MSPRGFSIVLFVLAFWAQPLLAQPSTTPVGVLAPEARTPPVQVDTEPANAGENADEVESEPVARDPFLTWMPHKIAETVAVSPTAGESAGAEKTEVAFDPKVYKVSGIVWGVEKARAIIDRQIVGVGDKVKDAEILRIDKDGVLIRFNEKEYLLSRRTIDNND